MESFRTGCWIKTRLAFSSIGVLVGLSAGVVFSMHFKNYNAGIWGVCSGAAALIALSVTIAFIKRCWDNKPNTLRHFMLTGCFIQLAGVCGFVAYIVLAISQNQALDAYGHGFYIASVWCFMTWKWGFLLLIYSRSYLRSFTIRDDLKNIMAQATKNQANYSTNTGYDNYE